MAQPADRDPKPSRAGDRHRVKPHSVRVDEALWEAFRRKVADEGKTMTSVLAALIRRYINE